MYHLPLFLLDSFVLESLKLSAQTLCLASCKTSRGNWPCATIVWEDAEEVVDAESDAFFFDVFARYSFDRVSTLFFGFCPATELTRGARGIPLQIAACVSYKTAARRRNVPFPVVELILTVRWLGLRPCRRNLSWGRWKLDTKLIPSSAFGASCSVALGTNLPFVSSATVLWVLILESVCSGVGSEIIVDDVVSAI